LNRKKEKGKGFIEIPWPLGRKGPRGPATPAAQPSPQWPRRGLAPKWPTRCWADPLSASRVALQSLCRAMTCTWPRPWRGQQRTSGGRTVLGSTTHRPGNRRWEVEHQNGTTMVEADLTRVGTCAGNGRAARLSEALQEGSCTMRGRLGACHKRERRMVRRRPLAH
jgi:hypothetical protein